MKLTSAEITNLWNTYMNDSGVICHLQYEVNIAEDMEIKALLQYALDISKSHIETISKILNNENYPIPHGFKLDEDVDVTAPRLFTDTYSLFSTNNLGKLGLNAYSVALPLAVREDIYTFFSECLRESDDILKKTNDLLLKKGLYMKPPLLPTPENFDFVEKKSFLAGYLGEKRPLTGTEITNLYANFQRNALGSATMIGYSQVANKKDVTEFILRGKEIAQKHCEIFGSYLSECDIPSPTTLDTEVTDSITYTFSDRKMLFYTTALTAISVGYYGASMSVSPRRDLGVMYSRLVAENLKFADEGARLMIKYGWLEEPPRALDRDELAKKKQG
ncbi:Protein of unknown function [Virgibacillus subterraneus]|uniref:DUF3231 family protein n=2 Tax=Virgibacillus TaxID=84406 RepID=A0A1H1EPG4_9BACI|nr:MULTISPECIES: DUF3231 family protein [Virgibacillus]SDQ90627.1 Protein of unknown function [Virgibacillus salinus]SEQ46889.1 Protein of unknown function [Virgibacillus subterraneus]